MHYIERLIRVAAPVYSDCGIVLLQFRLSNVWFGFGFDILRTALLWDKFLSKVTSVEKSNLRRRISVVENDRRLGFHCRRMSQPKSKAAIAHSQLHGSPVTAADGRQRVHASFSISFAVCRYAAVSGCNRGAERLRAAAPTCVAAQRIASFCTSAATGK